MHVRKRVKLTKRRFISRAYVKANPDKIFLFGDNLEQSGFGGQAREMRGEPNAVGIPTKKRPSMDDDAFFTDDELVANCRAIDEAFEKVLGADIREIVVPTDGLGTGLANMKEKAPKTLEYLIEKIGSLEG